MKGQALILHFCLGIYFPLSSNRFGVFVCRCTQFFFWVPLHFDNCALLIPQSNLRLSSTLCTKHSNNLVSVQHYATDKRIITQTLNLHLINCDLFNGGLHECSTSICFILSNKSCLVPYEQHTNETKGRNSMTLAALIGKHCI